MKLSGLLGLCARLWHRSPKRYGQATKTIKGQPSGQGGFIHGFDNELYYCPPVDGGEDTDGTGNKGNRG